MKSLYVRVLEQLLSANHSSGVEQFFYGSAPSSFPIKSIMVSQHGGENQGSDYWNIWKFNDIDGAECFIKFEGFHQSHSGTDYQRLRQVAPKPVTEVTYTEVQ